MPKKSETTKANDDEQTEFASTVSPVKLKPILDIRPGVYLTILYSCVLLLIFFFLFFFPGLNDKLTAALIVKTEPRGAAIRVNDVYRGLSGSKIALPKGVYTITAVMPGFESVDTVQEIKGRVFGSLFSKRLTKIELYLKTTDPAAAFALQAADYAQWSFAGEPTVAWQVPMSLSEGAYRTGPFIQDNKDEINQILLASSRFAVTKAALRDLIRAKILIDNKGNSPSPATLIGSVSDILSFLSNTSPESANAQNEFAKWLNNMLPQELSEIVEKSDWYKSAPKKSGDETRQLAGGQTPIARLTVSGLIFSTPAFPQTEKEAAPFLSLFPIDFMISETPVSSSLFETFLDENPEWKDQKTNYLPDEILEFPFDIDENIITGITWYAAQAFCKWFTTRLPSDMEARLPSEKELRYASFSNNSIQNPISRFGGWEWSADPYAPLASLIPASEKAVKAVGSPERVITGRPLSTTANQNISSQNHSMPADLSSPFITFRAVIARKQALPVLER